MRMRVNETYGPVHQGEGPRRGQPAVFLRTAGCNLDCVWCDTPYTWKWDEYDREAETHPTDVEKLATEIHDRLLTPNVGLVITGGEPMMQQETIGETLRLLRKVQPPAWVGIETNGTILWDVERLPREFITDISVSIKLENSGISTPKRFRNIHQWWFHFQQISPKVILKPVVCGLDDLIEVDKLVSNLSVPPEKVWVMPEGTNPQAILATAALITGPVLARGWNLTLRDQALLYPGQRAV
jgi:7-carboxy-7-deazaguanine synthase